MSVPLIKLNISPDSVFDELFINWTQREITHNNLMIFLFFFKRSIISNYYSMLSIWCLFLGPHEFHLNPIQGVEFSIVATEGLLMPGTKTDHSTQVNLSRAETPWQVPFIWDPVTNWKVKSEFSDNYCDGMSTKEEHRFPVIFAGHSPLWSTEVTVHQGPESLVSPNFWVMATKFFPDYLLQEPALIWKVSPLLWGKQKLKGSACRR